MAVPAGPTEQRYTGNGVSTIFAVPFLVIQASDLAVYLDGVRQIAGYTQSGVGNPTSTVTFTTAPALNAQVLLALEVPFERLNDYQENGDFLASTVNRDFDRIWQALKQLLRFAGRALTLGQFDTDGQGWYRAKGNGIRDLADPTQAQDAATMGWTDRFVGGLISAIQGPINNAANIFYLGPDGSSHVVQDLSSSAGASLVGAELPSGADGTVQGAIDELDATDQQLFEKTSQLSLMAQDNDNGSSGLQNYATSMMILGDSITESQGASTYTLGFPFVAARSILNARDNGYQKDPGFGWHTDINQNRATYNGYTSTGGLAVSGLVNARRSLSGSQVITVTARAYNAVYVVYDAASSDVGASIVISKNGVPLSTQAISGSSLNATAVVTDAFAESDVMTVGVTGGAARVCGVITLKTSENGCFLYVAGRSGAGYQDFISSQNLDEIAYWLNFQRSTVGKILVCELGTNNIYNPGKFKTPSDLVADMQALVSGVNSRATFVKYIFSVPPKSNESLWPVLSPGYVYEDYVEAIVDFCNTGGHGVIRHDLAMLSRKANFYADGLHPTADGHRIIANFLCREIGVPVNPFVRLTAPADTESAVTMNSTWRPYLNTATLNLRSRLVGNEVMLSGLVEPNGSVSTTVGTLPVGFRPIWGTVYIGGASDSGYFRVSINPAGVIVLLTSVPGSSGYLSFTNIRFPIARA